MADLLQHVRDTGFPYPQCLIHVFIGGSQLHGAKIHGTDDMDIYGVYVEPPEWALGLSPFPHFVWSTAGDDHRNGPNDIDVTLYSLRRWAELACKGNPTALHFLFSPLAIRSPAWDAVLAHKDVFAAKSSATHFLGFADNQLKRMTGERGRGKKGQRPALELEFGFDVKAAMHSIRLLYECKEFVTSGHITLPRPEKDLLIRVRTGHYSMDKVLEMARVLFRECEDAQKASRLPDEIDRTKVSVLIAQCCRSFWDDTQAIFTTAEG